MTDQPVDNAYAAAGVSIEAGDKAVELGFARQIHSKDFRLIETYLLACLMLVVKYDDRWALLEVAEIAVRVRAGAVDRYQPKPVLKTGKWLTAQAAGVDIVTGARVESIELSGDAKPAVAGARFRDATGRSVVAPAHLDRIDRFEELR